MNGISLVSISFSNLVTYHAQTFKRGHGHYSTCYRVFTFCVCIGVIFYIFQPWICWIKALPHWYECNLKNALIFKMQFRQNNSMASDCTKTWYPCARFPPVIEALHKISSHGRKNATVFDWGFDFLGRSFVYQYWDAVRSRSSQFPASCFVTTHFRDSSSALPCAKKSWCSIARPLLGADFISAAESDGFKRF